MKRIRFKQVQFKTIESKNRLSTSTVYKIKNMSWGDVEKYPVKNIVCLNDNEKQI